MDREPTTAYRWFGVPYVPHYREAGAYVGPGGFEVSLDTLIRAGATAFTLHLWPRPA